MHEKDNLSEKLGEILQTSLKRLDPYGKLSEYGVWPIWNEIVGPTIARHAQPSKIRHGTLFVKVSSSTWMQQLQYMKEMISDKLNQKLEKEVVKNVFFFVGNLESEISSSKAERSSALDQPSTEPKFNEGHPGSADLDSIDLDSMNLDSIKDPEIRRAMRGLFITHSRKGLK